MEILIDRLILLICGIYIIVCNINLPFDVVYILVGVICLGITFVYENTAYNTSCQWGYYIFIVAACFFEDIAVFIPLMLHSAIYSKTGVLNRCIIAGLSVLALFCNAYHFAVNLREGFILILSFVIAVVLGVRAAHINSMDSHIKKLRDDAMEKTISLSEKNRILSSSMDNEIRIATLTERNRIAREIHDNVGHILSRSILQLGAIMTINKGEKVYEQLEGLKDNLDIAMNSVRESVHDLHKEAFDLREAGGKILEELTEFKVNYQCDISMGADKEVKYTFITILKEAVTNIIKHCNGNRVNVSMTELEEYYQMLIEDNGRSKKNRFHEKAGIGLTNMEERIKKHGGIINFSDNNGFRIFISIPKNIRKQ